MNQEQKHAAIREALAQLGYHVRVEKGYSLYILPQATTQPQAA
jgi:hypothetical protein